MPNLKKEISILLIEDDTSNFILLKKNLDKIKKIKYRISNAGSISKAESLLSVSNFDIILLDIFLPDSEGIETFYSVQKINSTIPIIILTDLTLEELAVNIVQKGAQDYIVKNNLSGDFVSRIIQFAIERKKLENRLYESENRYKQLIEQNADGIILIDRTKNILFVNPAAERLFKKKSEELIGSVFEYNFTENEKNEIILSFAENKEAIIEIKAVLTSWKDRECYLISMRDETDKVKLREELHKLSIIDEMTQLYNRRGFFDLLNLYIKRAKRNHEPFLVFYIDMDNLKEINDTLGHKYGDMAIIALADIFKKIFRESDIIARIGGDEFAIFPIENRAGHEKNLKIRLDNEFKKFNKANKDFALSASLGTSLFEPESGISADHLIANADRAMYRVKKQKKELKT
jgi:diguanylate cyclase (GGDEF)-like protein